MLKVNLNDKEDSYIHKAQFLDEKHRKLFSFPQKEGTDYVLKFSEDQADELRDLCGEQLQVVGFDQNYELTKEGKILESLIDKFFIIKCIHDSFQDLSLIHI